MAAEWVAEYDRMLSDIEARGEDLSEWETTFVDSMRKQLEAGKTPSPKQCAAIDRLWEKLTDRRGGSFRR